MVLTENNVVTGIILGFIALGVILIITMVSRAANSSTGVFDESGSGRTSRGLFSLEHRGKRRENCNIPVMVYDRSGLIPRSAGHVMNMSATGACVSTSAALFIGDRFVGQVTAEQHKNARIEGMVVWVRPEGPFTAYGIQFL